MSALNYLVVSSHCRLNARLPLNSSMFHQQHDNLHVLLVENMPYQMAHGYGVNRQTLCMYCGGVSHTMKDSNIGHGKDQKMLSRISARRLPLSVHKRIAPDGIISSGLIGLLRLGDVIFHLEIVSDSVPKY